MILDVCTNEVAIEINCKLLQLAIQSKQSCHFNRSDQFLSQHALFSQNNRVTLIDQTSF